MANLVRKCQLRYFRRNSTVVIDERNDARIETTFGGLINSTDCFRVGLVFLAHSSRCTCTSDQRLKFHGPTQQAKTHYTKEYQKITIPDADATQARPSVPPVKSRYVNTYAKQNAS